MMKRNRSSNKYREQPIYGFYGKRGRTNMSNSCETGNGGSAKKKYISRIAAVGK
jgi:hypothetical protein